MFSGLIQSVGEIVAKSRSRLSVEAVQLKAGLGDSIAVNGVCLTVSRRLKRQSRRVLVFDLSAETLALTTLAGLKVRDRVNLEPALRLSDRLGGHLVQGHVDGVGRVEKIRRQGSMQEMEFSGPRSILRYVVPKGSVTVNGVSLTAVKVTPSRFSVALVPFTLDHTNLRSLQPGDTINLEADIIGKYVHAFLRKS